MSVFVELDYGSCGNDSSCLFLASWKNEDVNM